MIIMPKNDLNRLLETYTYARKRLKIPWTVRIISLTAFVVLMFAAASAFKTIPVTNPMIRMAVLIAAFICHDIADQLFTRKLYPEYYKLTALGHEIMELKKAYDFVTILKEYRVNGYDISDEETGKHVRHLKPPRLIQSIYESTGNYDLRLLDKMADRTQKDLEREIELADEQDRKRMRDLWDNLCSSARK